MTSESYDEGYCEGWTDGIDYVRQNPHKFGLTKEV